MGTTSDGGSLFALFTPDCQVYFPKWGVAEGKEELIERFGAIGGILESIKHHYNNFNRVS